MDQIKPKKVDLEFFKTPDGVTTRPLHISKDEIPHAVLDMKENNDSARYVVKVGKEYDSDAPVRFWQKRKRLLCVDKICYPANVCNLCKGQATFHRRMQQHGELMNVWRIEKKEDSTTLVTVKWDFCLDCMTEMVFEMFIFKKL